MRLAPHPDLAAGLEVKLAPDLLKRVLSDQDFIGLGHVL
jgi:hypothetical protein